MVDQVRIRLAIVRNFPNFSRAEATNCGRMNNERHASARRSRRPG